MSGASLAVLEEHGREVVVVIYLDTPPSAAELAVLLKQLGMTARELLRTGEVEYQSLGLDNPALDDAALIAAMVTHPKLIERPIVVANGKAALGRPPEAVLAIL
jgi:arsenate reductase